MKSITKGLNVEMAVRVQRIQEILQFYYSVQENSEERALSAEQKEKMVDELKKAYDALDDFEKQDVLIPAKGAFLKNRSIKSDTVGTGETIYDFDYQWPSNDGFEGTPVESILLPNEKYDRIGGPKGRYVAPLNPDGTASSYQTRALPYYIPEADITNSPAYHCYKVIREYSGDRSSKNGRVYRGKVTHAFWNDPDDGGGIQVKLPKSIKDLGGVLSDEIGR